MILDLAGIAQRIPHQGRMCLLDQALAWDDDSITCRSRSHLDPGNPLRARGTLPAVCGIEYAAQCMALHGALLAGRATAPGYLASVRGVSVHVRRLDDMSDDLLIHCRRIGGDPATVLYQFELSAAERPLLSGRAAVVLDVAPFRNRVT